MNKAHRGEISNLKDGILAKREIRGVNPNPNQKYEWVINIEIKRGSYGNSQWGRNWLEIARRIWSQIDWLILTACLPD